MNKFGLLDEDNDDANSTATLTDQLATFPQVRARPVIDIAASDAAASLHGFVSREPSSPAESPTVGRRRRALPSEPTRHLAIRLTASSYERFVAYADRYHLTYHDALTRLLDGTGD
jgi:hypothetical protein